MLKYTIKKSYTSMKILEAAPQGPPFTSEETINQQIKKLASDEDIATQYQLLSPYWLFTHNPTPNNGHHIPLYEHYHRGPFEVAIGPINAFSQETTSIAIDTVLMRYLAKGLFNGFPVENIGELTSLRAVMIDGFDPNRLVVTVTDRETHEYVGGVMVATSQSPRLVSETIAQPHATIPTLWALNFHPNGHLKQITESETVCPTRFARVEPPTGIANPRDWETQFFIETMVAQGRAIQKWSQDTNHHVERIILDTHSINIARILRQHWDGHPLDENPQPSDQVLKTPLIWHYQLPGIQVVTFKLDQYLEKVAEAEKLLGEKSLAPQI